MAEQKPSFFIPPVLWPGGTAYILGGGPSLADMDLSPLHAPDKHVIGVNDAYLLGNWVDVCWFGDSVWFDWQMRRDRIDRWVNFPGLKVTLVKRLDRFRGVKVVQKGKHAGIDKTPGRVSWNRNSGGSAINLAYHFGARTIVLLGFDMKKGDRGENNWHNNHLRATKSASYGTMRMFFKDIARDAEALGVRILNATPDSALTEFPTTTLEEVCNA